MNNGAFGNTMQKHRDTRLVITERRRNYLMSEPIYHVSKSFTDYLLAIEIKK